ncbi:MAG: co-chaperone YbbN [Betaproteobacteria bacterium]|nr:co-chaperone YbbN [Betaproteobacteria bacterium]
MLKFSLDVTDASFQQEVIEASKSVPVLVDFWAPWCGPCRVLKPVLEKLAEQHQGKFRLAKLNSDDNPEVSRLYGIRSIPNVKAFVDGQLADEFMGALPESQVRVFIDRLLPSPADLLRRAAQTSLAAGDHGAALKTLLQAQMLAPKDDAVLADLAAAQLAAGEPENARVTIGLLSPLAEQDERIATVVAKVKFAASAAGGDSMDALQARLQAQPADLDSRLQLANQHVARQEYEHALEQLLEIVRRDRGYGDDIGRKTMLSVFNLMGRDGDLVRRYRQQLAAAMN